jgi:general secretion pathway protein E
LEDFVLEAASITLSNNRLDAIALLNQLEQQGLLSQDKADLMRNVIRPEDIQAKGAIELLASKQLPNAKNPVKKLNLDFLCKWLADNIGLEFFTIDPLKIDVDAVTKIMSYAYAQRFGVLPVKVTSFNVTISKV